MRLIIIFRVTYVKIPILLLLHEIYRFECISLCQQVVHIILLYIDVLCKVCARNV